MHAMTTQRRDLIFFLTIISLLVVIGLIFIYSSSSVFALEKFGSADFFVKKQLTGLILGLCGLILCARIPLSTLKNLTPYFFLISLILTALTQLPYCGYSVHGSCRWLNFGGIIFQPSEILKGTLILYSAYYLSKKEFRLSQLWQNYIPFLCILFLISLILLRQPDFGQTITLFVTGLILFLLRKVISNILLPPVYHLLRFSVY